MKDIPPCTGNHGWQSKMLFKKSMATEKDRTMIYKDYYKLCNNFFLDGPIKGDTVNATIRRSSSRRFPYVSSSLLEFQTMYQWVSILQACGLGR